MEHLHEVVSYVPQGLPGLAEVVPQMIHDAVHLQGAVHLELRGVPDQLLVVVHHQERSREVGDVVRPVLAQLLGHRDAVQAPDGPEVLQHLAADVLGEPPAELHQVGLSQDGPDGRTRELSTRAFYTEYTLTSKLTPEYLLVSNAKKK